MKNSFKKLLNGMLVASTASMTAAATNTTISSVVEDFTHGGEKLLTGVTKQTAKKLQKYIIKFDNQCQSLICSLIIEKQHSQSSEELENRSDSEAFIRVPTESRKFPNRAEYRQIILSSISC